MSWLKIDLLAEVYIIISALAGMLVGYVLHRMRR